MKRRLLFLFLLFGSILYGQNNIYRSGGITQTIGAPTFTPGASGNVVAIDTVTGEWYVNPNRLSGSSWISAGYRLTNISGSVPPAYTPTAHQSHFVVNAANQLYYWDGAAWQTVGGGGSGDATRLKFIIVNKSGGTLNKGDVVYVSGAQGNRVAVKKALATSDTTSANTLGVMDETVLNNNEGYCVAEGLVSGLNTSAFTEGAALYLSPTTAGAFTQAKPVAPNHMVLIGYCVKSNNGSGEISVHPDNGYEIDELHNVRITTPSDEQVLTYDATNLYWKNATVADQSATNEIQAIDTFSLSGQTLSASLSSDGQPAKTVTLPVVNVTAGTGVSVSSASGNYTVTNSAPDQTVSITNGGGITPSGTYPNFTLTATDQSITNEIQTIDTFSLSGQTLRASLSSDAQPAKTVTLPIVDVVAGTNVTVSKANGIATVSATGGGGGSGTVTGTGVAGRAAFWRSTSAISSDANFEWDSTNVRLKIGAPSSPTGRLNVKGSGSTSSTVNFMLTDNNDIERFRITDDGELYLFKLATGTPTQTRLAQFNGYKAPYQAEATIEVGMNNTNAGLAVLGGTNRAASNQIGGFLETKSPTTRAISFNAIGAVKVCGSQILTTEYTGLSVGASANISSNIPGIAGVVFRTIDATMTSTGGNSSNFNQSSFGQITVNRQVLATTYTDASNVYIVGPPIQGSATLTNRFSLFVASGNSYFAENVSAGVKLASARLHVQGESNTSTTYSFIATNSGGSTTTPAICAQNNQKVGIGTNSVDAGATLEVDGTTGGILFPRLTTTQRDALTGVNGLMIYNTTTNKFQGYANGAWVDLH